MNVELERFLENGAVALVGNGPRLFFYTKRKRNIMTDTVEASA